MSRMLSWNGDRSVKEKALDRGGLLAGVGAYALWGLFPAFWPLLDPAAPLEVLAHRILWTTVLMSVVLGLLRGWRPLRDLENLSHCACRLKRWQTFAWQLASCELLPSISVSDLVQGSNDE